jgi:hypothetical protein
MLLLVVGIVLSAHLLSTGMLLSADLLLPADVLSQLLLLVLLCSGMRRVSLRRLAVWSWRLWSRGLRNFLPRRTRI